ncbi:MAG: hypothetical protein K6F99_03305 [Lachnospiraceae bacterium]|nr:hypothetical protein [Lachnospiraceae bacterium]
MKNISVFYDDRFMPEGKLKQLTGSKSFGEIIYKRKTLSELMATFYDKEIVILKQTGDIKPEEVSDGCVLHIFSHCVIKDRQEFEILLKKTAFARNNYRITNGDRISALVFSDFKSWKEFVSENDTFAKINKAASGFAEVESDAFMDIYERDSFLSFITGGFEARFFNRLDGDEHTVVKRSSDIKKIRAEYDFYRFLPDEMKSYFVMPYNYTETENGASYTMERQHMTDVAIRYIHGAVDTEEFEYLMKNLFRFLSVRKRTEVDWDTYYLKKKELYITKVEDRIESLKKKEEYKKIADFIAAGTPYSSIDDIVAEYEKLYDKEISKGNEKLYHAIGHGDLCFSNILYQPDCDMIRLIDPKGASSEADIYTDPYYDVAKLSHSVCGNYDLINSARYEIRINENMEAELVFDADMKVYKDIFRRHLEEAGFDYGKVRLFECSLFLSMLPLHIDRPQKVMAFILNAIRILRETEGVMRTV